jgi:hypothetical protein
MGIEFLNRVRKTSIILGVFLSPVIATYLGIEFAGAWLVAIAWTLVNTFFIGELVKTLLAREGRNPWRAALLLAVKFPVLYALGFIVLRSGWFPLSGILAGFIWPHFVMTMKACGRAVLKLEDDRIAYERGRN